MKKYERPMIEVTVIETLDIITNSGDAVLKTVASGDGFDDKKAW